MPLTSAQRMTKWREAHPERVVEIRVAYNYSNKEKESKRQQKNTCLKKKVSSELEN